ncbi:MAG: F0F1 ATP synthase subunit delta [Verrucomicrobiales bacterium]|nr:F0F1 ATP synthase subunit delta [Verrucomicrobiales bacterium]
MKVSKDALRHARALFQSCASEGKLDIDRVKMIVKRVGEEKPRGYLGILTAFQRLIRLDLEKRHAIVESAEKLSDDLKDGVLNDLKARYGDDVTSEFKVAPDLLGGMRVRVGSDIWDGSVKTRLDQLSQAFS